MATQTYTGTLVVLDCCECHVDFGVERSMYNHLRRSHESFWCPSGHRQWFTGRSDIEQARKDAADALSDAAYWKSREAEARRREESARHRERAQKAAKTRLKNRVSKGVCPACNRSFANLANHMSAQHPDFCEDDS